MVDGADIMCMTDMIAVTNHSASLTDKDVLEMCRACATQLSRDAGPAWGKKSVAVYKSPNPNITAAAWPIEIFDNSDQAGALGYHDETPQGQVYGRVFVQPVLDNGGAPLHAPNGLSVASVLSHEILEAWIDPYVDVWADLSVAREVAFEVGDPVEDRYYEITTSSGTVVQVSDFVMPHWFDEYAPAGSRFSFCGSVTKPFSLTTGGYWIERSSGATKQVFGEDYPAWKLPGKTFPAARSARRMIQ